MAHLWARWLRKPCRLGDPHRFRAEGRIRIGPLAGKAATQPLPSRGSSPLLSGGQNHKRPTCGQGGHATSAASESPPLQSGGQTQKWPTCPARWLHNPSCLGDPHRFRGEGRIRSGPLVGKVAV